jgi:hypothetical protein
MRTFIQSLLATAIIALPASGTTGRSTVPTDASVAPTVQPSPAATDPCGEALAQVAVIYAWHISSFAFCPTGLCIPLIEASGYALLLSTAYAMTVCAI